MSKALCAALAVSLFASTAPAHAGAKRPQGIYVRVEPAVLIKNNLDWKPYFECFYKSLLTNPALSGIQLSLRWADVAKGPNDNDWSFTKAAFDQVKAWNDANTNLPKKTIQLIITPGFAAPHWLLKNIHSCDPLFGSHVRPNGPIDCGKITITNYTEANNSQTVLPLPWDKTYKDAWKAFLKLVNTEFGSREELVSITMGGPSAASTEMFYPNSNLPLDQHLGPNQTYDGLNYPANSVWASLISNWSDWAAKHHQKAVAKGTDEVFIEEWKETVHTYATTFQNVTLILTPALGIGYPSFATVTVPAKGKYHDLYESLCGLTIKNSVMNMSCAATARILFDFMEAKLPNNNGKGSQISGLANSTWQPPHDFGIVGVRWLARYTASNGDPNDQIIGGAQFDHPYTQPQFQNLICLNNAAQCTSTEQEYVVLRAGLDGTTASCFFNDQASIQSQGGASSLNFLQIYYEDIQAAQKHPCDQQTIPPLGASARKVSIQQLYDEAALMLKHVSLPPTTSFDCSAAPVGCPSQLISPPQCSPPVPQPPPHR